MSGFTDKVTDENMEAQFLTIVPVIPSTDISRDIAWYHEKTGFEAVFSDPIYAGLRRDGLWMHLQWHAGTEDDPLLGGSVVRIFVKNARSLFGEFVSRGTVEADKFRENTPWHTNEFGFYDLNKNAIFVVEDVGDF